ncbi:MAG: hypothetical protein QOD99_1508 [Chthoniobacter sp.]|nr:hypothetical protein [Chthoniobacter sp.]
MGTSKETTVLESDAQLSGDTGDVFVFPASCAQQRFWMLDQLELGNPAYNVAVRFKLEGRLHLATLERAFNEIMQRHEVLRTSLAAQDGEPVQVIAPSIALHVPCIDLRCLDATQRQEEVDRLSVAEARASFDLEKPPLIRVSLLQLGDEEHMLLITLHHAISDGWSIGVITDELGGIYAAFARGEESPLPELPIQFADFTLWQRDALAGPAIREQLDYWKTKLRDVSELNVLTDRPRPAVQTFNGNIISVLLPKSLTNALHELSARCEVTLFTLMLSAFNVLLHRYTGQHDIVVGSPITGRSRIDLEPLIGVFINTLVLRNDLSGDPKFTELMNRVRDTVFGAMANQDLPIDRLVEALQPVRDAGRNPIFQVNFTYQRDFIKPIEFAGVKLTAVPSKSPGSLFDLSFFMVERAEGWRTSCEYNTDLFDGATVQAILAHFVAMLEGIAADPQRRISEFEFLSEAERQKLLVDWNDTRTDYPRDQTLADIFASQAARTPNAIAVAFGGEKLTYRELDAAANRLAHVLQRHGVGPDVPVGVLLERSNTMIVALLAILKAGGAYLPIEVASPPARIAFMLADAGAPLTLTQRGLAGSLPTDANALVLDSQSFDDGNATAPNSGATAENLAYVMFTSGSTGQPKGVAIPQRAVSRLVLRTNYIEFKPDDIVAQASNVAFDAATLEIWGALLNGAQLTGISTALAPRDFARELRERGITTLFLTTALFNQVARAEPRAFASLRYTVFGGEAADAGAVREIFQHGAPPEHLVNGYGPTEATTFAICHEVTRENERSVPIGRAICNTEIYLLDEYRKLVPIGAPGEIYIGGDGLARGYVNRPELNAERFVQHPFKPHGLLYRTGDLARYLPDGTIEYLGRIDGQIKLRGFRIELGEIEWRLGKHPAVREQAVTVHENAAAGKQLIAYVVLHPGSQADAAELREFVKKELPDYMTPAAFVFLDRLPVTANGKLDRRALPAPEFGAAQSDYVAPSSKTEHALAEIWEEVLKHSPVCVHDNFFEIGGHSLLALSLFARIESRLGRKLPLATLFNAPTIAELAHVIDARDGAESHSPVVAVQPRGTKPPFFCVHGADGGVLFYRDLGARFDTARPLYALEAPWLNSSAQAQDTIEEIAASYVREIRAIQPRGPYHLGGFSLGGVVAFEMAQQLAAAGERVGVLTLFDTFNPLIPPRRLTLLERVQLNRRLMAGMPWRKKLTQLATRGAQKSEIHKRMAEEAVLQKEAEELAAAGNAVPTEMRHLLARSAHGRAMKAYVPKPYPGSMLLFTAQTMLEGYHLGPTLGWDSLVRGELEICSVSGSHDTILKEPNVQAVCENLKVFLEKEDRRADAR